MTRTRFTTSTLLACAMICAASAPNVIAQNDDNRSDSNRSERSQRNQRDRDQNQKHAELPQALQKLDLKDDQKQQIRQAMQQHDQKLQKTWKQFHKAHSRAVTLEAAWTAAVRDTLSDADQQKFDQSRQQERTKKDSQSQDRRSSQQQANRQQQKNPESQTKAQTISSSKEKQPSDNQRQQNSDAQQQTAQNQQSDSDEHSDQSGGLLVVTVTSPVIYATGTRQSQQQQHQCSETCRQYSKEVQAAWQKAQDLHNELVQIEADRIQAIEEVLTEEQLTSLKEQRKQPQDSDQNVSNR